MNQLFPHSLPSRALLVLASTFALVFAACDSAEESGKGASENDGTGGGSTPGEGMCADLAEDAGWVEGEPVESIAESTEERIRTTGAQTWDLALRMLDLIEPEDSPNIANSPASMFGALGMTYGRFEAGQCGERIATVLGFPESGTDQHHTIGAGLREIESRRNDHVSVSMTQSIWTFKSDEVAEPSELTRIYGAKQHAIGNPGESTRELINCVIEEQSQGLLPNFLPEDKPNADTVSYDINVSYLEAAWAVAMSETTVDFSTPTTMTGLPGLYGDTDVERYVGENYTAASVPLAHDALKVLFVLPDSDWQGTLDEFAEALTTEDLLSARNEAEEAFVEFQMPALTVEPQTIDYNAEGMLGFDCDPFTLRDVLHSTAVEFDVKGIKAVAATAAEVWDDGGEPTPAQEQFHLDRPFLFFIYDAPTDFLLFSGRYAGE